MTRLEVQPYCNPSVSEANNNYYCERKILLFVNITMKYIFKYIFEFGNIKISKSLNIVQGWVTASHALVYDCHMPKRGTPIRSGTSATNSTQLCTTVNRTNRMNLGLHCSSLPQQCT